MAGNSIGDIGLDLVVNQGQFNRQMSSITGLAKKAGAALASAFAIKKIVDFGIQSEKLAQVQQEAETKLETVMRQRMKVTDSAIQSIKDFTSIQQQLGVVGDEVQMSGAQQLSTFLNSKKALETLIPAMNNLAVQQNGVNVSAGNMVEIGNLMGKVMQGQTSALTRVGITFSEAEEQALKYGTEEERAAVLAKVITNNVGEMNKAIANTPAGRIQQLKNNYGDLMEVVGAGIQNFIIPIVKLADVLVGKLMTLANAFKSFSELITGNKSSGISNVTSDAQAASMGLGDAADSAGDLADNTSAAGDAAKKAAKALMGFDKINKLDKDTGSSAGSTANIPVTGGGVDFGKLAEGETAVDSLSGKLDGVLERFKELAGLFKKGFKIGFGNSEKKISSIINHIKGIGTSLKDVFFDSRMQDAANGFFDTVAESAGKIAGAIANIGLTIAQNFVGGVDLYLQKSKEFIKDRLVSIFNVSGDIIALRGDFAAAFAEVFSVFGGESAQKCTASIIGIFADSFLGITDISLRFSRDILNCIISPFVDNKDSIKEAIQNFLEPVSSVLSTLHDSVKTTFEEIWKVYDEHIKPMFDSFQKGFSEIVGAIFEGYNEHIAPVLDHLADKFRKVWEQHVQPCLNSATDLIGKVADLVKTVWETVLQPVIKWIAEKIMPAIAPVIEWVGDTVLDTIGDISDAIGGIVKALGGVIDFITDIFKGDWEEAWNDVQEIFSGVWESFVAIVRNPINTILGFINNFLLGIQNMVNGVASALNNISIDLPGWLQDLTGYSSVGFNIPTWTAPQIPYLAQGGFVEKNTPQLAMIGDNRHQGEIVAPEDKLQEMVDTAVASVRPGITRDELEAIMNNAVMRLIAALASIGFNLDGEQLATLQRVAQTGIDRRYNTVNVTA